MKTKTVCKQRESSFELMRLVSMFLIVLYHLFLFFLHPLYENDFYKAIQIPLHIGVLLFVLISGYFGIKATPKGLLKLIGMMFVYYLPIQLVYIYLAFWGGGYLKEILKTLLFISHTPYWFMRTYICLFIFAPIINLYLNVVQKRILLLAFLFFISTYLGTSHGDPSLQDGKNLANFIFLYVIGNTLNRYKYYWKRFKYSQLVPIFMGINIALVVSYLSVGSNSIMGKAIWILSYPYCSPILLVNALLMFLIIGKIRLRSTKINYLASSTLAIYLIHSQPVILNVIGKAIPVLKDWSFDNVSFLLLIICYTLVIMFVSIFVDKALQPVWSYVIRLGNIANMHYYKFIGQ